MPAVLLQHLQDAQVHAVDFSVGIAHGLVFNLVQSVKYRD